MLVMLQRARCPVPQGFLSHHCDPLELRLKGSVDVGDVAESESPVPQVFLSYQWEAQDQVRSLRDHLERLGYACWMDVGQMGGGDHLNAKIEEGLRNCKVSMNFGTLGERIAAVTAGLCGGGF